VEKKQETDLISLKARAMALQETVVGLDARYERGLVSEGQYALLSTDLRSKRIEILIRLKEILGGRDDGFDSVMDSAITGEKDEVLRERLAEVATEKGWGERIIKQINEHRGTVVSWLVDVGLALAKGSAGAPG
jgi:hypothetical protein